MKKQLNLWLLLALMVLTTVLALVNRQEVVVNYLFGRFRMPLILVILGSVLVGFIGQYLLGLSKQMTLKQQLKQLTKDKQELTVALNNTERLNLTDSDYN
ncbi:LapA family protein [Streptococcus entericus]|uniref:LapA family protein n=1 Tax=Streptococcus entericus TaxID=155680 RepID=UPI0003678FB8|nr:LapA family protein [Streptococcus entericus]